MKKIFLVLFFIFLAALNSFCEAKSVKQKLLSPEKNKAKLKKKMDSIVIPTIEFEEVSIKTVIDFLRKEAKRLDPEKEGINIALLLPDPPPEIEEKEKDKEEDDDEAWEEDEEEEDDDFEDEEDELEVNPHDITITMVVDDIRFSEAIRYICRAGDLKFRINDYSVVIASRDIPLDSVETRLYPLESEAADTLGGPDHDAVKSYFWNRGIEFPKGSSVIYEPHSSRLIATNTKDNLGKIGEIIKQLNVVDPQVMLELKQIKISDEDLKSLNKTKQDWKKVLKSGKAEVLYSSSVMTLNGMEADIQLYTEKYFPKSYAKDIKDKDSVLYCIKPELGKSTPLGCKLKITPNVDADHRSISLDIRSQFHLFIRWKNYPYLGGTASYPILKTLSFENSIVMDDGETLPLQGMLKEFTEKTASSKKYHIISLITPRLTCPNGNPIRYSEITYNDNNSTIRLDESISNEYPFLWGEINDKLSAELMTPVSVKFDNTPMFEVLTELSKLKNAPKMCINMLPKNPDKITLELNNVPFVEVLSYLKLDFIILEDTLANKGVCFCDTERIFIKVRAKLIENICHQTYDDENNDKEKVSEEALKAHCRARGVPYYASLKDFFVKCGIPFPPGSSVHYDRQSGKIIIKNSAENNWKVKKLLEVLDAKAPLVSVESTIVKISQKDLEDIYKAEKWERFTKKGYANIPNNAIINKIVSSPKSKIIESLKLTTSSGVAATANDTNNLFLPKSYGIHKLPEKDKITLSAFPELCKTSKAGSQLKVNPVIHPNRYTVSLSLDYIMRKLTGWTTYKSQAFDKEQQKIKDTEFTIKMPEISNIKLNTNFRIYDNNTIIINRWQGYFNKQSGNQLIPDKLLNTNTNKKEDELINIFFFVKVRLLEEDSTKTE